MKSEKRTLKTLKKGLDLFEIVARAEKPLVLSEIVALTEGDAGTIHRFLATLVDAGYVGFNEQGKRYYLRAKVLQLSRMFLVQHRIHEIAADVMRELSESTSENVELGSKSADAVVVLADQRPSSHPMSVRWEIGTEFPLHCTAHGKALLAFREEAETLSYFSSEARNKYTKHTRTSQSALKRELSCIRAQGYALDKCEFVDGVCAVAAPIFLFHGEPAGTLGVSYPATRHTAKFEKKLATEIAARAAIVSERLGAITKY